MKHLDLFNNESSHIINIALDDKNPFKKIKKLYGLNRPMVIQLMRRNLHPDGFKKWEQGVRAKTRRNFYIGNFIAGIEKSYRRKAISFNRFSKTA